jgi:hypothetical protein
MVVGGDLKFLSNFGDLVGAASRNLGASKFRVHVPRLDHEAVDLTAFHSKAKDRMDGRASVDHEGT